MGPLERDVGLSPSRQLSRRLLGRRKTGEESTESKPFGARVLREGRD